MKSSWTKEIKPQTDSKTSEDVSVTVHRLEFDENP